MKKLFTMLVAAFGFLLGANAQTDLALTSIDTMTSGCGLTTQIIRVNFSNVGSTVINSPSVSYRVNGGAAVNGTIAGAIPVGGTGSFNFPSAYVFPSTGTFVFEAWVRATGDNNTLNDTSFRTVINLSSKTGGDTLNFDVNSSLASGGTNNSWAHGAPAGTIITTAPSSPNIWVTNLTGNYNTNEDSWIQTGCYDLSGLSQPMVRFDLNYRTENTYDGAVLEASTDGGSTWAAVGAQGSGLNWYNGALSRTYYTGPIWMNNSNGWIRAEHNLTGLSSLTQVIFRFHFYSDGSVEYDGVGIDNFEIYDSASLLQNNDMGVSAVIKPAGSGCGALLDTVVITVNNYGLSNQTNVPVSYSLNGGAPVNATIPGIIPAGTSIRYAFATLASAPSGSANTVIAYTRLANDALRFNDTASGSFTRLYSISGTDTQNFDGSPSLWAIGGTSPSWAEGVPTASVQNTAISSPNVLATNLSGDYNNNEDSWIQTSCYDISSLVKPMVKFDLNYITENNWDGLFLEATTDGGASWTTVGGQGSGTNWYNGTLSRAYRNGPVWMNNSNGWTVAEHTLDSFLNSSNIIFRFRFVSDGSGLFNGINIDNFAIFDSAGLIKPNDVGISGFIKPVSGCGLSAADSIVVLVRNSGTNAQNNVSVGYTLNGGAPVLGTVAGTLPAGAIVRYAFPTTVNLAANGTYNIVAFTRLASDQLNFNDTLRTTVRNSIVNTFPWNEDFENTTSGGGFAIGTIPSGWSIDNRGRTGTTFSWMAFSGSTSSFATGPTVDHTTGTAAGKYLYTETSYGGTGDTSILYTPCMNLSGLTAPELSFWYHKVGATMGDMIVEALNASGNWVQVDTILGQTQSNETDPWLERRVTLPTGLTNSQIRFIGVRGSSFTGDMAIDDVKLKNASPNDLQMVRFEKPISSCGMGTNDSVVVWVRNVGSANQTNVPVAYTVNGGAPVTGTIPSVAGGSLVRYAFPTGANLATSGTYNFVAYTALANDGDRTNDTVRYNVTNSIINTFPHFQDFETSVSGNGGGIGTLPSGWSVDNFGRTGFPFSWQAFAGSTGSTATGPTVDHTTGTATGKYIYTEASNGLTNDSSALVTPCMNMSALNRPAMSYWYHKVGATMGDLIVEYDNNGTWTFLDSILGQTHAAEADPWLQKTVVFPGRVTNTKIRFIGIRGTSFTGDMAIDDVRFFDSAGVALRRDASIVRVLSPTAGTKGTSIRPSVTVKNTGTATLNVFDINMSVNGVVALTQSFAGNLLPNDSVTFTFNNSYNYTSSGAKTICVYSSLANDVNRANDTSCITHLSSLSNQDLTSGVFVYPNPAKNLVTLEMGTAYKNGTLELINALGQVERRRILDGNSKQILSLEGLAEGIYIYNIQLDGKVFQGKLMIQK